MTPTTFYKYHGTGNDFVIIDNRDNHFSKKDAKLIKHICDRNYGVGADGLILLEKHETLDFTMVYYNADGNESSMCGNGGRCIASFAHFLGVASGRASFEAIDGIHHVSFLEEGQVSLQMSDVAAVHVLDSHVFMDTGSPHHVQLTDDVDHLDVVALGKHLRNDMYGVQGANINFVEPVGGNLFKVRTYERGVENETLSCGTGVTAVALAMNKTGQTNENEVILNTPGGQLKVSFNHSGEAYNDIWLTGPAVQVFKGEWS
jgi:diaminopimelate epimerase